MALTWYALQLAVWYHRAGERDTSNEGAQEEGSFSDSGRGVGHQVGVLTHVGGHARQDSRKPYKAVEGGEKLGEVCDCDALGDDGTQCSSGSDAGQHLCQDLRGSPQAG